MQKYNEAMEHNDKVLAADEAETADAPSITEGKPSQGADALADQASSLKARTWHSCSWSPAIAARPGAT